MLLVTYAALGVAMINAVIARKSAAAAERSASAAEVSATTADRSAGAAERSATASERYTEIEAERRERERQSEMDESAALLRAEVRLFVRHDDTDRLSRFIVLKNRGPADATDVNLEFGTWLARIVPVTALREFAILPADEEHSVQFEPSSQVHGSYPVSVNWTDGAGEHTQTTTLHLR